MRTWFKADVESAATRSLPRLAERQCFCMLQAVIRVEARTCHLAAWVQHQRTHPRARRTPAERHRGAGIKEERRGFAIYRYIENDAPMCLMEMHSVDVGLLLR